MCGVCGVSGQYPGESEVTFPPLTHIEITGLARMEMVEGKQFLVMPGKLSVNIKSLNFEQLVSQVCCYSLGCPELNTTKGFQINSAN